MRLYNRAMLGSLKRAARAAAREEGLAIRRTGEPFLLRCGIVAGAAVVVGALVAGVLKAPWYLVAGLSGMWVLIVHGTAVGAAILLNQDWRSSRHGILAAMPIGNREFFSLTVRKLGRWEAILLGALIGGGWIMRQAELPSFNQIAWGAVVGALSVTVVWSLAALLLAVRWMRWATVLILLGVGLLVVKASPEFKVVIDQYVDPFTAEGRGLVRCHPGGWMPWELAWLTHHEPGPRAFKVAAAQLGLFALSFPLLAMARRRCDEVDLAAAEGRGPGVAVMTGASGPETKDNEAAVRLRLSPSEESVTSPWLWLDRRPHSRLDRRERALLDLTSWRWGQVSLWGLSVFLFPLLLGTFLHPAGAGDFALKAAVVCSFFGVWLGVGEGSHLGELMVCHPLDIRECARLRGGLFAPRRLGILGLTWGTCAGISLLGGRFDPIYDVLGMGLFAAGSWVAGRAFLFTGDRNRQNVLLRLFLLVMAEAGWVGLWFAAPLALAGRWIEPAMVPIYGALFIAAPWFLGRAQERLAFRWADWAPPKPA